MASAPVRSWRAPLLFLTAAAVLAAGLVLLLSGVGPAPAAARQLCPTRSALSAFAGGRQLFIRADPAQGTMVLLHLCAERAIGPVVSWSIGSRTDRDGSAGAGAAVLRLGERTAVAVVPRIVGRPTSVTIVVVPEGGGTLTFTTRLADLP